MSGRQRYILEINCSVDDFRIYDVLDDTDNETACQLTHQRAVLHKDIT